MTIIQVDITNPEKLKFCQNFVNFLKFVKFWKLDFKIYH